MIIVEENFKGIIPPGELFIKNNSLYNVWEVCIKGECINDSILLLGAFPERKNAIMFARCYEREFNL